MGRRRDVFLKTGASNTDTPWFLSCFARAHDLGQHQALAPIVARFSRVVVDPTGATSWSRDSVAATPGWHVASATTGSPSPLEQEIAQLQPAFAIIMFGTNDVGITGVATFEQRMTDLVRSLADQGIVPILNTIPPRADDVRWERETRALNQVLRAIARSEDLPLLDVYAAVVDLPGHALQADGIHLSPGVPGSCQLTGANLERGFPVRNLVTLEALARLAEAETATGALDPAPAITGTGTPADPYRATLPLAWTDDTTGGATSIESYDCAPATDESGPERWLAFEVPRAATLRFAIYDRDADIDLHVMQAGAPMCLGRDDKTLDLALQPGSYRLALDSFVSGGAVHQGWFRAIAVELP